MLVKGATGRSAIVTTELAQAPDDCMKFMMVIVMHILSINTYNNMWQVNIIEGIQS